MRRCWGDNSAVTGCWAETLRPLSRSKTITTVMVLIGSSIIL